MEVIPAIDLRNGLVVRLYQGDYDNQTIYSTDPVKVACAFEDAGASRIHVVDLDGAFDGVPRNTHIYEALSRYIGIPFQIGGGLRTIEAVNEALAVGADRVIIGTIAITDRELVNRVIAEHGAQRIVVGLDTRDGFLAINGWTRNTRSNAVGAMTELAALGVGRFVYTDIGRDGTLTEPNFDALASLIRHTNRTDVTGDWPGKIELLASGGISSIPHLEQLADLGFAGAIVGRAIYTGAIDIATAVAAVMDRGK